MPLYNMAMLSKQGKRLLPLYISASIQMRFYLKTETESHIPFTITRYIAHLSVYLTCHTIIPQPPNVHTYIYILSLIRHAHIFSGVFLLFSSRHVVFSLFRCLFQGKSKIK